MVVPMHGLAIDQAVKEGLRAPIAVEPVTLQHHDELALRFDECVKGRDRLLDHNDELEAASADDQRPIALALSK